MLLEPGTRLDRYQIQGTLGEGAMAIVYRAEHVELGSLHALKKLKIPGQKVNERLLLEGRLQSSLKHPNVVSVTDLITIDGVPALVMEFVAGPTLAALLKAKRLTIHQSDAIVRDLLKGIAAAHAHGLIHRDLKPHNILMAVTDDSLVPKVADFGLAKVVEGEADPRELTRTGMAMGTPAYMAPEQIRDASNVDNRADVFSLGAILYEIVTGAPCFQGESIMEIWEKICAGDYRPVQEAAPEIPKRMAQAIEAALLVDPEQRTSSVSELYTAWCADAEGSHVPIPGRSSLDFWPEEIRTVAASMAPTLEQSSPQGSQHDSNTYAFMADDDPRGASLAADSSSSMVSSGGPPQQAPPPGAPPSGRSGHLWMAAGVGLALSALVFFSISKGNPKADSPVASAPEPPQDTPSYQAPEADTPAAVADPESINGGLLMRLANLGSSASTTLSAVQFAGRTQEASTLLRATIELDPSDATETQQIASRWRVLQEEVGGAVLDLPYLMQSHSTQAIETLRKAIQKLRDAQPTELAWSLLQVGSLQSSAALNQTVVAAKDGLQHHPNNAALRLSLASALNQMGRYEEARPHIERLLRSEGSEGDARSLLSQMAIAEKDEAKRIEHLLFGLSDALPLDIQVRFLHRHGNDLAATGQVQEAEKVWDLCIREAEEASEFNLALLCASAGLETAVWLQGVSGWAPWQDRVRSTVSHPAVNPDLKQAYATLLMATEALFAIREGELELASKLSRQLQALTPEQNPLDPSGIYAREVRRELAIAQRDEDELRKFSGRNVGSSSPSPYFENCTYHLNQVRVHLALDDQKHAIETAEKVLKGQCAWDRHQPFAALYLSLELAAHHLDRGNSPEALPMIETARNLWSTADATLPSMTLLEQLHARVQASN
ncbi:MAG: protein kinase [Myxococcota bacterium]|nr:protein kinase [Myxococcota bacterium]